MALEVNPPWAIFKAPFDTIRSSEHIIKNDSPRRIAFKVKTTNNKLYRVSLIYGFIAPHSTLAITVGRLEMPHRENKVDKLHIHIKLVNKAENRTAAELMKTGPYDAVLEVFMKSEL